MSSSSLSVELITAIFINCQRTHFAIAFELPGGWKNIKEAMTLTVLQVLIFSNILCLIVLNPFA